MTTVDIAGAETGVETAPATFAQDSLIAPESAINVPSVVALSGPVELSRVRSLLDTLTARHGALRTVLTSTPDGGRQTILPEGEVRLDRFRHDRTVAAGLAEVLRAGSQRPFAVDGGRLARADLHDFADRSVLVLWLHHAISDLVTSQVLAAEIAELWRGGELPPPSGQMAEYARYERGLEPTPEDWAFWSKTLADVDDELDVGYPAERSHLMLRPALPRLDPDVVTALQRLATAGRTTLTAVLAAAVVANHAVAARRPAVLIGLTISNREQPRWRTTVGCLADQIPLVVDVSGHPTFRELVGRVREALLDAYDHRLPLGRLRPLLRRPDLPLFAVNLNFLPPAVRRSSEPAPPDDPVRLPYGIAKSSPDPWWLGDASLAYRPRLDDGELAGEIEGDARQHDAATVAGFGERFIAVLAQAARYPDRPIQTLVREVLG